MRGNRTRYDGWQQSKRRTEFQRPAYRLLLVSCQGRYGKHALLVSELSAYSDTILVSRITLCCTIVSWIIEFHSKTRTSLISQATCRRELQKTRPAHSTLRLNATPGGNSVFATERLWFKHSWQTSAMYNWYLKFHSTVAQLAVFKD